MCGILAVLSRTDPSLDKEIKQGSKIIQKRGPDESQVIKHDGAVFSFQRLAIVDPTHGGMQPFVDGRIIMMCNGEIYNHRELEQEYKIKCHSGSDCEIILHLYKKIGFTETIKKLDGVFAIVLMDGPKVFYTRDRIGVRPLFVGNTLHGDLVLGSVARSISHFALAIEPLNPGMVMEWDRFENTQSSFYNLRHLTPEHHTRPDFVDAVLTVRRVMQKAVFKRLMSDRPVGCLLSGGLDSSIVAAVLVKFLGADQVRTYSIGMEGSVDLKYAQKVADFLGTHHVEFKFTPEEGLQAIPEVIEDLETYDVTTVRASTAMWLLSKHIAEESKDIVILSGEGADELFQGYLYFHNAPSVRDATEESLRLLHELYKYDVLRADRSVSCHGLELRVPFLDRNLVDTVLAMPEAYRRPREGFEKYLLRKAFEDLLPPEVAWRRKDGMSDGIASLVKPWYQYIQEYVETRIGDELFDPEKYLSKEAMYYHLLFKRKCPGYHLEVPLWMPKWSDAADPSGRQIKAFDETD
jgi:asparagine synthase (glutamine-hydrolysing)